MGIALTISGYWLAQNYRIVSIPNASESTGTFEKNQLESAVLSDAWRRDLTIGVLSAVLATAMLYIFGKFWNGTFIPWLDARAYKGRNVSGRWALKDDDGRFDQHEILELKQKAQKLSGTIALIPRNEPTKTHTYLVEGESREGYILINLRSQSSGGAWSGSGACQAGSRQQVDVGLFHLFGSRQSGNWRDGGFV